MFSKQKRNPSAADVMRRAIILKYIFVKGFAAPPIGDLQSIMSQWSAEEKSRFEADTAQMYMQIVDQLKAEGLWQDTEEDERKFLQSADGISAQQRTDASWLAESIVCLLWALQIIPELPSYDQEASHESVKALPTTSIKRVIRQAHLRSQKEIRKQRDIAELWHWRARIRWLQQEGRLNGQLLGDQTIEQVIEFSASKAAKNGDLATPIESDFPALGRPYRELSSHGFAMLSSIAQERHKAFNWLCGFSPSGRWADTPTDS